MQALYRKYRSKSLAEVVGQQHITDTLSLALKNNVTSHAYLFTGPRGVGKTSVARIMAHELNKIPYTEESQHLDIIEIDAASNRRIDDVRDLRDKINITPVNAPYKVYIIDEVHMLTGESFNALLKTLEEPPAHVVFILATTEVHKLPATIVSRTQRFHFRPVGKKDVTKHLSFIAKQEGIQADNEALELIAEYGEGSFRDSISLLDQLSAMSGKKINAAFVEESLGLASSDKVASLVKLLNDGNRAKLHAALTHLEEQGVNPLILAGQIIRALKNEAINKPEYYGVIESLLDLHKSSQPSLKLMVTLLKAISGNETRATDRPARTVPAAVESAPNHSIKQKPANLRKPRTDAVAPASSQNQKPSEPTAGNDVPASGGDIMHAEHWPQILGKLKASNPPLFSVLKKAEPRFNGDTLTLAVSFKLHQIKLNDSRYRTKLAECIATLGFACPALEIIHDAAAMPPVVMVADVPTPEADETASSVLAMMGGGDIVNAE